MTCMSVENSEQEEALTNKLSLLNVCLDATEDQAENSTTELTSLERTDSNESLIPDRSLSDPNEPLQRCDTSSSNERIPYSRLRPGPAQSANDSPLSENRTRGSRDNHVRAMRTRCVKRPSLVCITATGLILGAVISSIIGFILTLTLQTVNLPAGSIVLGITNATLLLTLNPTDVDQVTFSGTEDTFTAVFYESKCSDIKTETYLLNYTRSLYVTEQQYGIDTFYFVKNSIIHYRFTASEIHTSSSCVARIHVFNDHQNYFRFISTGLRREVVLSYCLSPPLPLSFTVPKQAATQDRHYYVGLESFATTTITYRATGDLIKHNTTGLSPTTCTFPTTDCSISLSGGKDVCILAQLEDTEFIPLSYTTHARSQQGHMHSAAGWTFVGISFLFSLLSIILCTWKCLRQRKDR